jgi:hypothetical protein
MTVEHAQRAHAKLSASGSAMWLNCPGSIKANTGLVDKGSAFAAEGTAAHELAEMCLNNDEHPSAYLGQNINGFEVDVDMVDYIGGYVEYVRSINGEHHYEQRVDFSRWVKDGFGTADAIVLDGKTLHCIDLKYGKGVAVDAENNSQGMLYGLGAYESFSVFEDDFDTIKIHIYQPRIHNFSEWAISLKDLLAWGDWVNERADLALSDNAPRVPGEKQCKWCKAKATCKALADYTNTLITAEFDDLTPSVDADKLNDDQLANVLAHKSLITEWLNAVEHHALEKLEQGEKVPGFKLVAGRSIRKWSDNAETILTEQLGDQAYNKKLIGIGDAEKLIGKKELEQMAITIKPEGKPTIVPESDKRKPLQNITEMFE